jgi:hypothetical protein
VLIHHELCFGCGRTNLFGLHLEAEETARGSVAGRAFIKQDHQGATLGQAHDGIVTAALAEALAFAVGPDARLQMLEIDVVGSARVGEFLDVEAHVEGHEPKHVHASATATADGQAVARARASYGL